MSSDDFHQAETLVHLCLESDSILIDADQKLQVSSPYSTYKP
jgi:hypothetical protein